MDSENHPKSAAVIAAEAYFGKSGERHQKGSGLDIIAAERERTVAKSARLKAAREEQEIAHAQAVAEIVRKAGSKPPTKKRVPRAKP